MTQQALQLLPDASDWNRFANENPSGFYHFKSIILERYTVNAGRAIDQMKNGTDEPKKDPEPNRATRRRAAKTKKAES